MKRNKNELNVDVIGGEGAMTDEEQARVSEFIRVSKLKRNRQTNKGKLKTP